MEFHTIPSYPNYEVSKSGKVRSKKTGNILKSHKDGWGQMLTALRTEDGRHTTKSIHRILAETFLGLEPGSKARVTHLNGIKTDNRLKNLSIDSKQAQTIRQYKEGRIPAGPSGIYINVYDVSTGVLLGTAYSTNAASKLTGVSQPTISLIINNKYNGRDFANGYRFEKA
jgi:hypothetical protein